MAEEAEVLRAAIQLRGNPLEAGRAVQDYRKRFPNGALAREADVIELQSDVAAGRTAHALGLLNHLDRDVPAGAPFKHQVRLLHAEFLARDGDCSGAAAVLRPTTHETNAASSFDSAAFGRAFCAWVLKPPTQGREAMQNYLTNFPDGSFRPLADGLLSGASTAGSAPEQIFNSR